MPWRKQAKSPSVHLNQRQLATRWGVSEATLERWRSEGIITPLDAPQEFLAEAKQDRAARAAAQDSALMRALGLAHHWQRLLDEGRAASVAVIATAEGMDVTQVRRILRLTLLAPEVIERLVGAPDAVLEGVMRRPWPNGWEEQKRMLVIGP